MHFDHSWARRPGGRVGTAFQLGIFLFALLLAPRASADEPAATPANEPAAAPANEPAAAPANEPAATAAADTTVPKEAPTAQAAPVPASVLAMVNRQVILRLRDERTVEGRLVSANKGAFVIEKSDGTSETVPRAAARGIRLTDVSPAGSRPQVAAPSAAPALVLGSADAPPSDDVDPDLPFGPRRRLFGMGTSFGGGFAGASTFNGPSASNISPALLLPALELQVFLPREYSLDLVVPVATMALSSALLDGTVVNMDLYFNANVGRGRMRLVAGPGIGFSYLEVDGLSAASVRFPAQLGFEALSKKRGFGFKMLARPWVEVASGSSASAVGGGLLGVFVFSGYVTDGPASGPASAKQ